MEFSSAEPSVSILGARGVKMSSGTVGPSRTVRAGLVPHVSRSGSVHTGRWGVSAVPDVPVPAVPAAPSVAAGFTTP